MARPGGKLSRKQLQRTGGKTETVEYTLLCWSPGQPEQDFKLKMRGDSPSKRRGNWVSGCQVYCTKCLPSCLSLEWTKKQCFMTWCLHGMATGMNEEDLAHLPPNTPDKQWIYLLNWFTYLAVYSDINWTLNMETVSKYMRQPKIMESGMALPGGLRFYVPTAKGAEGRRYSHTERTTERGDGTASG